MKESKINPYINREVSWLAFNERVLMEALDNSNPLMEKIRFVSIFSSNLDEFFMVRVASLKDQIRVGYTKTDNAGFSPEEQLEMVAEESRILIKKQQEIFKKLQKELLEHNYIFDPELTDDLYDDTENIFIDDVVSVISPVTLDPAHPIPFIYNKRMSIIVELERDGRSWYSLIMLPENMRRFFRISYGSKKVIIMVESIIKKHVHKLYKGFNVKSVNVFRITRNADMEVMSEDVADIILTMKDFLSRRVKGSVTRVEIEEGTPCHIIEFLKEKFCFEDIDIKYIDGVIDLTFLQGLSKFEPALQFKAHTPFYLKDPINSSDIFDRIKTKDIFFFRPYYSFDIVSKLIAAAAEDKNVLAIKMTLYRTNRHSSILASLLKAAKSGKQVSVVVELKARFDEEQNIDWAENLEDAGCIVTYGIAGLKIHAKCLLIVRREQNRIKRYTHIATGNYNENTAKVYTDVDLITSDEMIGRDAAQLFNYLMAYTEEKKWSSVVVSPFNLRSKILSLFDDAIQSAKLGQKARITMKMNSLIDKEIIDKIYEASKTGVKIDLIVRGICGLKAGVKGLSENIRVKSIIGRFLEHARIFCFQKDNRKRYFISSADMMPRNLNRRVELMVEIKDEDFKNMLSNYLKVSLSDNLKGWDLHGDKFEKTLKKSTNQENSQEYFMNHPLL